MTLRMPLAALACCAAATLAFAQMALYAGIGLLGLSFTKYGSFLSGLGGPIGWFLVFFVAMFAETNRTPFDLPEAESELVAGYQVEYSSTPYLLFMIGEYLNIVLMCAMINILFLGGWHLPWGPVDNPWLGFIVLGLKMWFIFFLFAMVKAIVPRYRYDQLMRLGWKIFLPTSLVAVAAIGYYVTFVHSAGVTSVAGAQ